PRAGSPMVAASAITTSGCCSQTLCKASAAFPASATTARSSSLSSKLRSPCRKRTWSCTRTQRILLLKIAISDGTCALGHTATPYGGQRGIYDAAQTNVDRPKSGAQSGGTNSVQL